MKKSKILIAGVLVLCSFFVGGVVGFYKGYFLGQAADALSSSASTVLTLGQLHKNNVNEALTMLDQHLDGQVVLAAKLGGHSIFDVMGFSTRPKVYFNFIKMIAKHRQVYPRTNRKEQNPEDLQMQQFVDATLQGSKDSEGR